MREIDIAEAEGRLAELLVGVEAGEEIVVTRDGKAVARFLRLPASCGREGDRAGLPATDRLAARAAAGRIRARRAGVTLGGARIAELIAEGRR